MPSYCTRVLAALLCSPPLCSITNIVEKLRSQSNGVMKLTRPAAGGTRFKEPAGTEWLNNVLHDGLAERRNHVAGQLAGVGGKGQQTFVVDKHGGSFGFGVERDNNGLVISAILEESNAARAGAPPLGRILSCQNTDFAPFSHISVVMGWLQFPGEFHTNSVKKKIG